MTDQSLFVLPAALRDGVLRMGRMRGVQGGAERNDVLRMSVDDGGTSKLSGHHPGDQGNAR